MMADSIPDQHLDGITVTAKSPAMRVTADKTVFDLKSIVSGDIGTLLDALSAVPGISVSQSGTVTMYGNRGATILVDGQKIYLKGTELVNYLRTLPASIVSTVSLRTISSAKDDATDKGGIIEISTHRQRERGAQVTINGGISTWNTLKGNGSMNTMINRGHHEISLICSSYAARSRLRLDIDRPYKTDSDRMQQLSTRRRSDNSNLLKAGWLYKPSPRATIGTGLSLSRNCRNEHGLMDTEISSVNEKSISDNHTRQRWKNIMADIFSDYNFDSDAKLQSGLNYFHYTTTERQSLHSTVPDTLSGRVKGNVEWLICHADFTKPLGGGWRMELGAKHSIVSIKDSGSYFNRTEGQWTVNNSMSAGFRYNANTSAAYAQASFSRTPFSVTAGLRMEYERLHAHFSGNESSPDTAYRSGKFNISPNITLKFIASRDLALMMSYTRRLGRPNYADLNPFIYVFDESTLAGGNIKLHNSTSDNLQFGLAWQSRVQATIFFTHSSDAIMKSYHEISDRAIYATSENFPLYVQLGARIVIANTPVIWSRWTTNLTAIAVYNRYDWRDGASKASTRKFTPIVNLDNRFDLGRGWVAELKASFTGKTAYGQVMVAPFGNIDIAVRKSLMRKRASLSLFIKDIFATNIIKSTVTLSGRSASMKENEYRRIAGISFSLKFQYGKKTGKHGSPLPPDELSRIGK